MKRNLAQSIQNHRQGQANLVKIQHFIIIYPKFYRISSGFDDFKSENTEFIQSILAFLTNIKSVWAQLQEQQKGKDNFEGTTQNIEEYDSLLLEKEKREKNNMKQELISQLKDDVRRILKEEQNEMRDTQQLYEEDMGQRMYERNEIRKLVVKDLKTELMPQLRAEVIQSVLQDLKESTNSSVDSINLLADADAI